MVDTGAGVFPVYHEPRLTGPNPSATFLADSQDNDAWAVFGDVTFDARPTSGNSTLALRYDEDTRENTTETPTAFLPDPAAFTGEVRKDTWSEWQPKATLRFKPSDNLTFYGGWSRGFRSGGFNQTGVGAVADASGIAGVNDLFEAEVADTWEVGRKGQTRQRPPQRRREPVPDRFHQRLFLRVPGRELDPEPWQPSTPSSRVPRSNSPSGPSTGWSCSAAYGFTDSEITGMEDPSVIGNHAPLVTDDTLNLGAQYTQPLDEDLDLTLRADFQRIGRTWWEPYNMTSRDPVSLLDVRIGLESDNWTVTAWGKNLTDEKYNTEFSPGGFLFKALPRRYGVEFNYRF